MTPAAAVAATAALRPHPQSGNFRYLNLYTSPPHVLVVALHRPRKRNALNAAAWKEIGHVFGKIGRDAAFLCRSVLLTAEEGSRCFCAGIDVTDPAFFPQQDSSSDVAHQGLVFVPLVRDMQACFSALETCPVPVVAAVHGPCLGAGVDLITAADVRLASGDATTCLSVREVVLGLTADVGTLQRLPKICGSASWVREICLTGRDVAAREAAAQGFWQVVDDSRSLQATALALCHRMAQHSPVAVRGTKEALVFARDHSVAQGLAQVAAYNALALQSPDLVTGMQARLLRQPPIFGDVPAASKL